MSYNKEDVLLVDFFDTCVSRTVHPEYVKYLWASRIREALGLNITACETYRIRNAIEAELCEKNRLAGFDQDFYFPDFSVEFYHHINKNYKNLKDQLSEATFTDLSSDIEIKLELETQFLIEDTIELLKKEKSLGKNLILVSDFYLSRDEFLKILSHHGILDLFSEIFVSSEYKLTKRSGRLFDLVISECNLDTSRTTMIGDNLHSDYEVPKSKGISAIHLDHSEKKTSDDQLFLEETSLDHTRQEIFKKINPILENGPIFSNIVLTLYFFISKLFRQLSEDGIKDAFFLSREGEFLKILFDHYQKTFFPNSQIKSHYFLASRKSTFLPSLKDLSEEDFNILFRQYVNISGRDFLLSLNLEEDWVGSFAEQENLEIDKTEAHFPSSNIFKKITTSKLFQEKYEKKRLEQRNLFTEYLNSFKADLSKQPLALIDVGWKGSMQDNIRKILPKDITIKGYYLGLFASPNTSKENQKEGIVFTPEPSPKYASWIFSNTLPVYEILLGASHGSATEYYKNSDKGTVEVNLTSHPYEVQLYNEQIKPLLESFFMIFKTLCDTFKETHFSIENFERLVAEHHAAMVLMPSAKELDFIEQVSHFENFGVFKFTEFVPEKVSLARRIINAWHFFYNPHKLLKDSMWPAITFKKLGLGNLQKFYGWYQFKLAFDNHSRPFKIVRRIWKI